MKRFSTLLLLAVLLYACQKEANFEEQRTFWQGQLLRSVTNYEGSDSGTQQFRYDASKRLQSIKGSGYFNGDSGTVNHEFVRNGSGIIQTYSLYKNIPAAGVSDSIIYTLLYDGTAQRYKSKVTAQDLGGMRFVDSTVYSYNTAGKINGAETFQGSTAFGIVAERKYEYTYLGDNVKEVKFYQLDPNTLRLEHTQTVVFEYDANPAALYLGIESIIMETFDWLTPNNVIKQTHARVPFPPSDTATYNYTYTNLKQPKTVVRTLTSPSSNPDVRTASFVYYP